MKKFLKIYLIIAALVLFSCQKSKVAPNKINDSINVDVAPDQISWDATVYFVDSSYTKAVLKANRARVYNDRQETVLDRGVQVDFLTKKTGERESKLTADSAKIDDRTKDMLASGNVVVIADSTNTKLETPVLEWNNEERKLYSTEFVRITSPSETIEGYGFESNLSLTNYKIFKVSGTQKTSINKKEGDKRNETKVDSR